MAFINWVGSLAILAAVTTVAVAAPRDNGVGCKDIENRNVDWFVIYKIPQLASHPDKNVKKGMGMLYMDPNNLAWLKLDESVMDQTQPLAYTLNQIYQKRSIVYGLYNDEIPDGKTTETYGHTKGGFAFDYSSGFWLIHSVPHFPPRLNSTGYGYPQTGTLYGQSAFCMSLKMDSLEQLQSILLYNYPWIYDYNISDEIRSRFPTLVSILTASGASHVQQEPWNTTVPLTTLGGMQVFSYAKYRNWHADLYYDWVAPALSSGLYAETWQNGGGNLPSECQSKYPVNNVQTMSLPDGITFGDHQDHSKWAVTVSNNQNWICIGDINRQVSQAKRAGGTNCFQNTKVWKAFHEAITNVQTCNSTASSTGASSPSASLSPSIQTDPSTAPFTGPPSTNRPAPSPSPPTSQSRLSLPSASTGVAKTVSTDASSDCSSFKVTWYFILFCTILGKH